MISLPSGSKTVDVQIIDSTSRLINAPTSVFVQPDIKGFETFNAPAYCFLITHTDSAGKKRQVVFDLGVRKDWNNLYSGILETLEDWRKKSGFELKVDKDVSEILTDDGVDLKDIEAVIWRSGGCPIFPISEVIANACTSHGHFDHVGNMQTFPSNVDLIVGPGLKDAYMPGWPKREISLLESDFAGRNVQGMSFEKSNLKVADFHALDFFGDGSFYLLDAPGVSKSLNCRRD